MALHQLDTENADRNLTSLVTVLTDSPAASGICIGLIKLGDGTKNLSATGGAFQLVITVGGQTVQPSPQTITFSTAVRAAVWTTPFPVVAGNEVIMSVLSPNAADSDVDVTAYLYDMTYALPDAVAAAAGGLGTVAAGGLKLAQTVDLTAGQEIAADLTKIHGTAITETATQLAAAFTKFFDVATPTGTVNEIKANVKKVNDVALTGNGSTTPWGPA
jgi:hypothetical protein